MTAVTPLVLHRARLSGHSHRAELMLRLLDLPHEVREVDLPSGAHKAQEFLKLNRFGTVPVLEDAGRIIPDSAAILVYLATRYDPQRTWLPTDAEAAANVQRWLSVAQGPLFNGPNSARLAAVFRLPVDVDRALAESLRLFEVLEDHLRYRPFLVGDRPTIADIANYSYVARAPEGGLSLEALANIRGWLSRIEALPGFIPMPHALAPSPAEQA